MFVPVYFIFAYFQHQLRGTAVPADLEKGRGRHVDRRRQTHDGARRLTKLVADSLDRNDSNAAGDGGGTIRVYRLYNRCSMKYVRIAGKRVDAAASDDDIYSA